MIDLMEHQREGRKFLASRRAAALWWSVGTGKTLTTLVALDDIEASRVLVVGTRNIVENVWPQEIADWGFDWDYGIATRSTKRIEAALDKEMILTNYENLIKVLEMLPRDARFDVCVFDELSKMKAPGTKRFRKWVSRVGQPRCDRVWGLTGSPAANHLLNVWGQIRALTKVPVLESTYGRFKSKHFYPVDMNAYIWKPRDDTAEWIEQSVAPMVSYCPKILDVELMVRDHYVTPSRTAMDAMAAIDAESVWGSVTAANSAVVGNKLIQLSGGAVYDEHKGVIQVDENKIDRVVEIVDELQGKPVIIAYTYKHERTRLMRRLPQARDLDVEAWNRGEIEVMLVHPASAGHGLNLQKGGSTLIFYSLPWSAELYDQTIGRLHRTGQTETVIVHRIISGFDNYVARALRDKNVTQHAFVEAVQEYIKNELR